MRWEGVPAGSVNTNARVETDRGAAFLRVYEAVGAAEAAAELRLVAHLRARGVPTPAVLARRDGALLGAISGKPAALFELVGGRELCLREGEPAHARAVGDALARMHLEGRDYPGAGEGRFTFGSVLARMRGLEGSADAVVARALPLLRDEAAALAREQGSENLPRGVIHGDLFRDNVRFEGARVVALIDFESASTGTLVYDLATCLLAWTFYDDFRADLGRALVDGYAAVRPLESAERAGGLYREARRAALRFTVTRITDFHLRPQPAGARREKDFRRYVARLARLRALGPDGVARMWAIL